MLELIWPGKTDSAQRASQPGPRLELRPWNFSPVSAVVSADGTQESHRIIAADNLLTLHLMRAQREKFDVIYIDPPYNTGSALTYSDKKSQRAEKSGGSSVSWLNEIYPRLLLAREVLNDGGVLFVSIDDNEVGHLQTILREIFGYQNHLGTIKWRRKRKPSFLDKHMSAVFEYVLVFARNAEACPRLLGDMTEEDTRPVLNSSNKIVERMIPAGFSARCRDGTYAPQKYQNRSLSFELLDPLQVSEGKVLQSVRVRGPFRIHQELWEQTGFITKNFGLRRHVLDEEKKRRHAEDDGSQWPTNEDAQEELRVLFGERVFDFPKPVGLLMRLLSMVSSQSFERPLRCLDFYAGSGSFLIAALEQSRSDGIARVVTLVQSREKIRSGQSQRFSDIAEICAHRVVLDSARRGFSPSFNFLQLEQRD